MAFHQPGTWLSAASAVIALLLAFGSGPASAQQPNDALVRLGAQIWKDTLPCRNCHGAFGHGVGDIAQEPRGPNLRQTALDQATVETIVRCGLPGTEMPFFDSRSYADDRCYGMTAEAAGAQMPPTGVPAMAPRQVQAVVAFLFANIVGKGPVTREECLAFWGPEASTCGQFRPAAEVGVAPAAPAPAAPPAPTP